jgi:CRISPR-associated exonuclease Cas4
MSETARPPLPDPDFGIGGTLIWYYFICPRQVWLIAHQLTPDGEDTNIQIGRLIDETSYAREKKQLIVGSSKMDIFRAESDGLVVGEVKKSSRYRRSARMQLAFYLKELRGRGVHARGELRFPREKEIESVELTDTLIGELDKAEAHIREIVALEHPPLPARIHLCTKCAYAEFCWS